MNLEQVCFYFELNLAANLARESSIRIAAG
jgi:hypothetical protein